MGKILTYFETRFALRSQRFIEAYEDGLTGPQAAWAYKKYKRHRNYPKRLMEAFDV